MRLLVFMRDGRTVYRLTGRGTLRKLCAGEPWDEDPGAIVQRGIWSPSQEKYRWIGVKLRHLAKGSISVVEEDSYTETPAP